MGVVLGGVVLLIVVLAAVRSPASVREPRAARGSSYRHGPFRTVWKGRQLGLPPYGPNSLATIARRFGGSLIDSLVLVPLLVAGVVARHTRFVRRVDPTTGIAHLRLVSHHTSVAVSLLLLVPGALYAIGLIAVRGQTVGEMALGLRVARRVDGAIPGWAVSARRWLLPAIPTIVRIASTRLGALLGLLVLVDFAWALWDPNRQCLHDKLADTVVVNTA